MGLFSFFFIEFIFGILKKIYLFLYVDFESCYFVEMFIRSKRLVMEFFRSFKYKIILFAKRDNLISFYTIYIPFYFFLFLMTLVKISSIILSKCYESGYPYWF
jgi:hypothetical protein